MFKSFLISMAVVLALISTGVKSEAQTMGLGSAGGAAAAYTANAVDFDSTNDSIARGADLTSAVDDPQGIISVWFRMDGSDGVNMVLIDPAGGRLRNFRNTSNDFNLLAADSAGAAILSDLTSGAFTSGVDWHHLIMAWDATVPTCQIYLDDTDEPPGSCNARSDTDGTATDWFIGILNSGSLRWDGCMSEFYYNQTTFLDMDTVGNRRLFNDGTGGSAGGEPVDLGSDGSTPTSGQPIVYLNGSEDAFATNAGSGGNFVVTGALSACSTSPTD